MKYLISNEYGCVHFLNNSLSGGENQLCFIPLSNNNSFDTEEWGIVELPHDEIPQSYIDKVMKILKGKI